MQRHVIAGRFFRAPLLLLVLATFFSAAHGAPVTVVRQTWGCSVTAATALVPGGPALVSCSNAPVSTFVVSGLSRVPLPITGYCGSMYLNSTTGIIYAACTYSGVLAITSLVPLIYTVLIPPSTCFKANLIQYNPLSSKLLVACQRNPVPFSYTHFGITYAQNTTSLVPMGIGAVIVAITPSGNNGDFFISDGSILYRLNAANTLSSIVTTPTYYLAAIPGTDIVCLVGSTAIYYVNTTDGSSRIATTMFTSSNNVYQLLARKDGTVLVAGANILAGATVYTLNGTQVSPFISDVSFVLTSAISEDVTQQVLYFGFGSSIIGRGSVMAVQASGSKIVAPASQYGGVADVFVYPDTDEMVNSQDTGAGIDYQSQITSTYRITTSSASVFPLLTGGHLYLPVPSTRLSLGYLDTTVDLVTTFTKSLTGCIYPQYAIVDQLHSSLAFVACMPSVVWLGGSTLSSGVLVVNPLSPTSVPLWLLTASACSTPTSLEIHRPSGTVYVVCADTNRVYQLNTTGARLISTPTTCASPTDLSIHEVTGDAYVACAQGVVIFRNGTNISTIVFPVTVTNIAINGLSNTLYASKNGAVWSYVGNQITQIVTAPTPAGPTVCTSQLKIRSSRILAMACTTGVFFLGSMLRFDIWDQNGVRLSIQPYLQPAAYQWDIYNYILTLPIDRLTPTGLFVNATIQDGTSVTVSLNGSPQIGLVSNVLSPLLQMITGFNGVVSTLTLRASDYTYTVSLYMASINNLVVNAGGSGSTATPYLPTSTYVDQPFAWTRAAYLVVPPVAQPFPSNVSVLVSIAFGNVSVVSTASLSSPVLIGNNQAVTVPLLSAATNGSTASLISLNTRNGIFTVTVANPCGFAPGAIGGPGQVCTSAVDAQSQCLPVGALATLCLPVFVANASRIAISPAPSSGTIVIPSFATVGLLLNATIKMGSVANLGSVPAPFVSIALALVSPYILGTTATWNCPSRPWTTAVPLVATNAQVSCPLPARLVGGGFRLRMTVCGGTPVQCTTTSSSDRISTPSPAFVPLSLERMVPAAALVGPTGDLVAQSMSETLRFHVNFSAPDAQLTSVWYGPLATIQATLASAASSSAWLTPAQVVAVGAQLAPCTLDTVQSSDNVLVCITPSPSHAVQGQHLHFLLIVGGQWTISSDSYSYPQQPQITSVSSSECVDVALSNSTSDCPTIGGITITIGGTGFSQSNSFAQINGLNCPIVSIRADGGQLQCTLPAGAGNEVPVVIQSYGFFSPAMTGLSYAAPTITNVSSSACIARDALHLISCDRDNAAALSLTLTGINFGPASALVFVGSSPCLSDGHVYPDAHSQLSCILPAGKAQDQVIVLIQKNGKLSQSAATISYIPCSAGSYDPFPNDPTQRICRPCDAGTFAASSGAMTCSPCPVGHFANDTGSASCEPCGPRTYQDGIGASTCRQCSTVQFQPSEGSSSCLTCPDGLFLASSALTASLSDCTSCPAGSIPIGLATAFPVIINNNATTIPVFPTECAACPTGRFAGAAGATNCLECAVGQYGAGAGLSSCASCDPRTFQDTTGRSVCHACATGMYQPSGGSSSCASCPVGLFLTSSFANASSADCHSCDAGSVAQSDPVSGLVQCVPCQPGTFAGSAGRCVPCAAGTISTDAGATTCSPCPARTFQAALGQTFCSPCLAAMYQPNAGSSSCAACPAGLFLTSSFANASSADCHSCEVGSVTQIDSLSGQVQCVPCEAGTFAGPSGRCVPCAAGTVSSEAGATSCTPCAPRTYQPSVGQTVCVTCPTGSFQASSGAIECTTCPAGLYLSSASTSASATDCLACPPGASCAGARIASQADHFLMRTGDGRLMTFSCPLGYCTACERANADADITHANVTSSSSSSSLTGLEVQTCCAPHRLSTSALCGECEPDYIDWHGTCLWCPSSQTRNNGQLALYLLLSLALVLWMIYSSAPPISKNASPSAMPVILYFVQTAMLQLGSTSVLLSWLQLFNFDPSFFTSNSSGDSQGNPCMMHLTPEQQVMASVLTPLFLTAELASLAFLHRVWVVVHEQRIGRQAGPA